MDIINITVSLQSFQWYILSLFYKQSPSILYICMPWKNWLEPASKK